MELENITYEEWNNRLALHFFNPGNANKRVYLHTTTELLDQVAGAPGAGPHFVTAVKQGPAGLLPGELCEQAIEIADGWRTKGFERPPYIAYLCLLALAATREGPWPAYAYYPRLWNLLDQGNSGSPHGFYRMSKILWRDLEAWTHNDTKGAFGLFTWQSSGKWIFVGLPVAQTLLTDAERKALPELFRDADLEPGSQIPEAELTAAIARVAQGRLCHRTCVLLNSAGQSDHKTALLDTLQSELIDWDGTVTVQNQPEADERRGGLRIWLKRIDPAGFVESKLVAYLPDSTSPDDLLLETAAIPQQRFACDEQAGRVTNALHGQADGRELAGDRFDWAARTQFRCLHTGIRLILPAAEVRIFIPADTFGLGGFIETRKLPPHGEFFLAAAQTAAAQVAAWGGRCCPKGSWRQVPSTAGLPHGWTLFHGADLKDDGSLSAEYPALSLPHAPRLSLEGGIKVGGAGAYFPFALPAVSVEWHEKPSIIECNKIPLGSVDGFNYCLDPSSIQAVNKIEALFPDNVAQLTLFVQSEGWSWSKGSACPTVDRFGLLGTTAPQCIRGAAVDAPGIPGYTPAPETAIDDLQHAVLLGRRPGQVANIRRGDKIPQWAPVWAVSVHRRDVFFTFCGSSLEDAQPEPLLDGCDTRKWADLLWVHRKRVKQSPNKRVRQLLKKYQEVARAL
jgi:hypothetical protein